MRSPFPGMDPYLEQRWGDFHSSFITYIRDALQPQLPEPLRARMEERVYVEPSRVIRPDVNVHEFPSRRRERTRAPAAASQEGNVALADPVLLQVLSVEATERYIEIIESENGKVVTVIEVLSPANKDSGRGRPVYLRDQRKRIEHEINLVEIDLLHSGQPTSLAMPDLIAPHAPAIYHICIRRSQRQDVLEYYPISLREALPSIPIPLRPEDRDVALHLQSLLDMAYDRGRYDDIDYNRQPVPAMEGEEARWADQTLKAAGVRS